MLHGVQESDGGGVETVLESRSPGALYPEAPAAWQHSEETVPWVCMVLEDVFCSARAPCVVYLL